MLLSLAALCWPAYFMTPFPNVLYLAACFIFTVALDDVLVFLHGAVLVVPVYLDAVTIVMGAIRSRIRKAMGKTGQEVRLVWPYISLACAGLAAVVAHFAYRFPLFLADFQEAYVERRKQFVFEPKQYGSREPDLPIDVANWSGHRVFVFGPLNRRRAKNGKLEPTSAATPAGSGAEPGAPCSGTMSLLARETLGRAYASLVSLLPHARGHTLLWTRRSRKMMVLPAARVSTRSAL